jgi:hypothetical protein
LNVYILEFFQVCSLKEHFPRILGGIFPLFPLECSLYVCKERKGLLVGEHEFQNSLKMGAGKLRSDVKCDVYCSESENTA